MSNTQEAEIVPAQQQRAAISMQRNDIMSIETLLQRMVTIQRVMREAMQDGKHYGTIPGCGPKPTLLLPGAQKIAMVFRLAPSYLVKNGTPQTIEDLAHHKLLLYTYVNKPNELHFTRDNKTQIIKVRSLLEANDGQILRTAALEGLGILIQPNYIIYDDVVAGRLIPILEEWDLPKLSINIAYQRRKNLPARVRAFIDFLIRHFREKGHERKWTR